MNGWIKYFAYGRPEYGDDYSVANKLASWSCGRLQNIISTELWHNNAMVARIVAPGRYHQSDDFDVSVLSNQSRRIIRRLQFLIEPHHEFVVGKMTSNSIDAYITNSETLCYDKQYSLFTGIYDCIGQWLTVEYDIRYDTIGMYITKEQI